MRLTKMFLGLIAVLLAMPCLGNEIIVFKSGQTMAVVSHRIEEGMIHVDLGGDAFVAFPEATIDAIEVAGKNVLIRQSNYGYNGNRITPTTSGNYPVTAVTRRPGYEILTPQPGGNDNKDSNVHIDGTTGMAVYYPMAHSTGRNKRRFGVTGDMRALSNNFIKTGNGESTYGGTTPVGTKHVFGGLAPRRSNNSRMPNVPIPVSVTMKPGIANGTRPETPRESDDDKKDN
jgi:hypothetical protein